MAKIRDLGINFIPGASRNDLELTPVIMAAGDAEWLAAGGDEKKGECDGGKPGESTCSITDDDCGRPQNPCSITDEDCNDPGTCSDITHRDYQNCEDENPCSITDAEEECDGPEYNCSITDEDCGRPQNPCSITDDEDEDEDGDSKGSTKALSARDVALLTQQLEQHLAN